MDAEKQSDSLTLSEFLLLLCELLLDSFTEENRNQPLPEWYD